MTNLISVIVPAYQHASTLGKCLDSILSQTYPNFEVIVVNDGSTDNTAEVLKSYQDRVKVIVQENQGANPARNRGREEARGEFIIFCDADVIMKPMMLDKLHQALIKHSAASYAYSAFKFGWKRFGGVDFDAKKLRERNFIHTSALIRSADFLGFDNQIKRLQDWDVWLTMLENGKVGILVPEFLFEVVVSGKSRIGSSWMPSFMFKIPWKKFFWQPKQIKKYKEAREIIAQKHHLED